MLRHAVRLFALAAVLWAAAAPEARIAAAAGPEAAIAERMLARINHHRSRAGLAPVALDAALGRAAHGHARAMADGEFFAHESRDGTDFSARAGRAGYKWRLIAENIAAGLDTPESTVDGWMDSEGHRRNMLTPRYRDAGVGHVFLDSDPGDVRYRHYWVLMLGLRADP
jgi:uncharacterized protein YkwD